VAVGQDLLGPLREGVCACAVEVDTEVVGDRAHQVDVLGQLVHRLRGGRADPGGHLDRVAEQFMVEVRILAVGRRETVEDLTGGVDQVTSGLVDQAELPLDPEGRAGGGGEVDTHRLIVPQPGSARLTPPRACGTGPATPAR
jgi:hypothetical protein